MSIEFRCSQCNKLLRTGDDTAGKQAKCPECGTIQAVPQPGTTTAGPGGPSGPPSPPPPGSPFSPGAPPDAGAGTEIPYQSPGEFAGTAPDDVQPQGGFTPTRIEIEDVFSRTWTIFKQQWGTCLIGLAVAFGVNIVVNVVVTGGAGVIGAVANDETVTAITSFMGNVITTLFSVWIGIGQAFYFLKIARGRQPEVGEIFSGGPYFLPVLGASILFGLIVLLGYVLLIVPGVILSMMFSQYYFLILDRRLGVMDSLNTSREFMIGNKLTVFLIWLIAGFVALLIVLLTCFVGIFAVAPFMSLLTPVMYLAITGQPTADQMMPRQPLA